MNISKKKRERARKAIQERERERKSYRLINLHELWPLLIYIRLSLNSNWRDSTFEKMISTRDKNDDDFFLSPIY